MVLTQLEKREVKRRVGGKPQPLDQRPRPDLPLGTDLLPKIRHIVVLMMENHSYDSYLGMLAGRGDGFPLNPDGTPRAANPRRDGGEVAAHHWRSTVQEKFVPTQGWNASHLQWNSGACDGFVRSVEITVPGKDPTAPMGYWTEQDLPFYYGLARTFPLADRWFCSCLGPTFPNRRFLLAGTAHGLIDDLPFGMVDYPPAGTVFDLLTRNDISWVNYHSVTRASIVLKRFIGGARGLVALRRLVALGRWFPPLVRAVKGSKSCTADMFPLGLARCLLHLRPLEQFFADADAGTLPAFSLVDPDFGTFSEENPQDISHGESFAAEVIKRVTHGKGWPDTLLIWTYDEHGGYYDHVTPPAAPRPDDVDGHSLINMPSWLRACLRPLFPHTLERLEKLDAGPLQYDNYGFRVPAVIVSPYAKPGYVSSQVFDHTSVLKLLEHKWNLPPLTARDAAAVAPLDMLDLNGPPAFLTPPDLPAPSLAWGSWSRRRRRRLRL
jgi:phospholipase C